MVSHRITLVAIFLLAFEGSSVLTISAFDSNCHHSLTIAPTTGAAHSPYQLVIPAVIKAVVQSEPACQVPSVGNYAPNQPPIVIEADNNDNWQDLLYLLLLSNNKRGIFGGCNSGCGGYNGYCCGCNGGCGGCNRGCGGCNGGCSGYNCGWNCGCGNNWGGYGCCPGGYDCGCYSDDCCCNSCGCSSPREINLIIKTDSGTCTTCQ